jgi:hypothetical protein
MFIIDWFFWFLVSGLFIIDWLFWFLVSGLFIIDWLYTEKRGEKEKY